MSVQSITRRPSMEAAACRHVDPEIFFGVRAENAESRTRAAKLVCSGCLVREPCLRRAMEHEESDGVWGGLTPAERRRFGGQIHDLLALGEGLARRGDLDLMELGRTDRRARPGVVLLLADRGWTDVQMGSAMRIEPAAVRAALATAERVVAHCRSAGLDAPTWARFILPSRTC
ncbi:WhiB family transcriptional regulator [Kitasatospora sp. MBT63]|uniref:WhiB family transcriptional regulator n=1 Tax=Kitasatospora sp. MBT63 TaxID=1444768 RepID=UPI0007C820D8|nr:WhiB family transcriptional regulator [Kitasatospora sp. MBT63]